MNSKRRSIKVKQVETAALIMWIMWNLPRIHYVLLLYIHLQSYLSRLIFTVRYVCGFRGICIS